jgi:hypothetical protein
MAAPYDPTNPSDHHHSRRHPSLIFVFTITNVVPYQPLPLPFTTVPNPAATTNHHYPTEFAPGVRDFPSSALIAEKTPLRHCETS